MALTICDFLNESNGSETAPVDQREVIREKLRLAR